MEEQSGRVRGERNEREAKEKEEKVGKVVKGWRKLRQRAGEGKG